MGFGSELNTGVGSELNTGFGSTSLKRGMGVQT